MKRKSLQTALLAAVMGVVSMPHAVLAADAPSEAAAAVNAWIGYQLRDDAGQYLTVANGAAETGSQILSYAANGVAAYNIWYFTETGTGIYTLKSSLSEGEFYATASDRQTLELQLQQDGMQQQFTCTEVGMNRIHLQQNETDFGTYTLEPVTWLKPGDVNRDGVVNVLDLSLAKRLVLKFRFLCSSLGRCGREWNIGCSRSCSLAGLFDAAADCIPSRNRNTAGKYDFPSG